MSPNSKGSLVFKGPPPKLLQIFGPTYHPWVLRPGTPGQPKTPQLLVQSLLPIGQLLLLPNRSPQNRFKNQNSKKNFFQIPFSTPPPGPSHPQKQNCWSKFGFKLVNFFLLLNKSPQFSLKTTFHYKNFVEFLSPVPIPPIVPVVLCCPFLCFRNSSTHRAADTRKHTEREREEGGTDRQTEGRAHTHSESQIHRQTETREEFAFLS